MPDYAVLKAWLDRPEHAGLSDAAAAAAYNAETVTVREPITRMALRAWGARSGARNAIRQATASPSNAIASIALAIEDLMGGGGTDTLDLDDPNNQAMLAALVQAGVLTPAQRDDLMAQADRVIPSYARPGGFGVPISEHDIRAARELEL
jgi:hypothetical protein